MDMARGEFWPGVHALTLSGFGRPDEHHHHRNSEAF
jgi:hypothetical protein